VSPKHNEGCCGLICGRQITLTPNKCTSYMYLSFFNLLDSKYAFFGAFEDCSEMIGYFRLQISLPFCTDILITPKRVLSWLQECTYSVPRMGRVCTCILCAAMLRVLAITNMTSQVRQSSRPHFSFSLFCLPSLMPINAFENGASEARLP